MLPLLVVLVCLGSSPPSLPGIIQESAFPALEYVKGEHGNTRKRCRFFTRAHHRIRLIKAKLSFLDPFPECCSSFRQGASFHDELELSQPQSTEQQQTRKQGWRMSRAASRPSIGFALSPSSEDIRPEIQTSTKGNRI